jgi:hypothetical protein
VNQATFVTATVDMLARAPNAYMCDVACDKSWATPVSDKMGYPNLSRFDAQLCTMSVDDYLHNGDAMCTLKVKNMKERHGVLDSYLPAALTPSPTRTMRPP